MDERGNQGGGERKEPVLEGVRIQFSGVAQKYSAQQIEAGVTLAYTISVSVPHRVSPQTFADCDRPGLVGLAHNEQLVDSAGELIQHAPRPGHCSPWTGTRELAVGDHEFLFRLPSNLAAGHYTAKVRARGRTDGSSYALDAAHDFEVVR